ncbi:MAG: MlaD family protein, partial [Cyanobacteria bacterium J06636_16]
MRARAIREGSVGLLILVGVGLFGGLVLWLRGLSPGSRNYEIAITFDNSLGMQIGTPVRYRGVPVGRVVEITPLSNQIEVLAEITEAGLRIPRESTIAANQSGFIGETTIDITPKVELTEAEQAVRPTGRDCESGTIICDGDRIDGLVGVSYEALLRSAIDLSNTLTDPDLVAGLKTTLENTMAFTEQATALTEQLSTLTADAQEELEPLSDSVQQATNSAAVAADNAAAAAQEIQITTA